MTTQEYLESIQTMDIQVAQLQEEIKLLRSDLYSLGGATFDAPERGKMTTRNTNSPFAFKVEKLCDMETLLQKQIERLAMRRRRIIRQIQKIRNLNYVNLLFKRYVEFKTFIEIANEMHYSHDHIRGSMHRKALSVFELVNKKSKHNTQ